MVALTRARDGFSRVFFRVKKAFWNRAAATNLSKGKDKDLPHLLYRKPSRTKRNVLCYRGDINLLSTVVKLMPEHHKYVSVSARMKQELNKFGPQHSK